MKTYMVVCSNPVAGKEVEYNDWYTNVHLKEVLQVKGLKAAQRFILTKAQMSESQAHKYMAIYEIENDDIEGTVQRLAAAAAKFSMKPVIDMENATISIFQSITDEVKQ